jgi:CRISPR type III-A/MTUBE-associated protein Csm6
MYFTKKMLEYEQLDGRYTWAAEQLGKKLNHHFEIKKIERADLTEVQIFDSFYEDFENIFDKIESEYPNAELYANASSGTPAIKSAVVITAAMSKKRINVIQVSSGEQHPLHDRDKDDNYDKQIQWECDEDNKDNFIDRTTLVKSDKFLVKVKKENVRKFISAYDYSSALTIAKEIRDYISADAMKLIRAAAYRLKLDYKGVKKSLSGTNYEIVPIKDDKRRDITEYFLWLGIILKNDDYLSFIRGITPAAMALMEAAVSKATPIGDIKDYCEKKNDHYILTAENLRQSDLGLVMLSILDEKFKNKGGFRDGEYTTAQLEALIQGLCEDKEICKYVNIIRKTENNLRNPAAHTIVAVSDELIQRKIHMTAAELYEVIKKMAVRLGLMPKNIWNSYDEMNELILNVLN